MATDHRAAPAADRLALVAAYGGDIITLEPGRPRATALLALGGRLIACGSDDEIRAVYAQVRTLRGVRSSEPIDLRGRAVLPGLIDSHLHLLWYGFSLQAVAARGAKSLAELRSRVAARTAAVTPGEWITGAGWHQDGFNERRMPSRGDLDAAAPLNPVALHRVCHHAIVANSRALELAGVTADTPDPPGGAIDRDPATGEPTGILREQAMELVTRLIPEPSHEQSLAALRLACRQAAAAGLTSVHTNDGNGSALPVYLALRDKGELTVRAYFDTTMDPSDDSALRLPAGIGDEWVRLGAVKMFADGSLGAHTALLREPYTDKLDTAGLAMYPQAVLDDMVLRAHSAGRQVAIHAIGDRAVDMSLAAVAAALRLHPRPDHRHRLIHAQLLARDLIERLRDLRMVVDIQPAFVSSELSWAPDRLGTARQEYAYCWRTLLDQGVRCAGGSDCPVEPLAPLRGLYAAVTRSDDDGQPPEGWLPDQRLDPLEAIRLFTVDAAYAAFEEDLKGTLEPGKLADFVVLSEAPDKVAPHEIKDITVEMTVVGGKVVHTA